MFNLYSSGNALDENVNNYYHICHFHRVIFFTNVICAVVLNHRVAVNSATGVRIAKCRAAKGWEVGNGWEPGGKRV